MNAHRYIFLLVTSLLTQVAYGELIIPGASLFDWGGNDYSIFGGSSTGLLGSTLDVKVDSTGLPILLNSESSTLTPGNIWYEVAYGTAIDANYVLDSTTAFHNGYHDAFEHLTIEPITITSSALFYVGFWISDGYSPKEGDVFGWAKLSYNGTVLQLLDSAAENDGVGIYAGQYQQVPEPSSVLLLTMGAGGILFYRRSKQRQQEHRTNRRSFQ